MSESWHESDNDRITQNAPWFFDVLAYRPPPYQGECLSGYLLRLAQANGVVSFWDFISDLFPTWRGRQRISVLRWEYPVDNWGRIPLRTQLSLADLRKLTVAPWIEKFRHPLVLSESDYLSPGHFLRGVVHSYLQVCPLCLQEQPYLRLMWRLAPVQVCLHHSCQLQTKCHECGAPLSDAGGLQRYLHCAMCDADLCGLPVVSASEESLATQQRRQDDLQFLLDPDVKLVKLSNPHNEEAREDLRQAIGLKFRYLRYQSGHSSGHMAQVVGVSKQMIGSLELGERTPLPLYLAYLEVLSRSWPDFATLEVPQVFVHGLHEPPYMSLRLCPTPGCPNHQPPPSMAVTMLREMRDQQIVRFRCTACGRTFTRTLDGKLTTKARKPPIRPGEPPPMIKSPEEIARLVKLGLQGESNRRIAHILGWGEKTVRIHWISLGLENQVHQAQSQRRAEEQRQRHVDRCTRVETVLQSMLGRDEEITLREVGYALGQIGDYLQNYPDLAQRVLEVARPHNAQVKERRCEALRTRIIDTIQALRQSNGAMTVKVIAQQAGVTEGKLRLSYPDLHAMVRQTVTEHKAELKASRAMAWCDQINRVAARMVAHGDRPTYNAILSEIGLNKYQAQRTASVLTQLRQWIGDFAPRD